MVVDIARTEGSRDVIRGCGGTKKHRKSHRSSAFNRRVKNLSVTGHLRSETKVRLLRSRRGPILTGRPHRHSHSALEQGEGQRQGPTPTRQKLPLASSSANCQQHTGNFLVARALLTGTSRKLNLNLNPRAMLADRNGVSRGSRCSRALSTWISCVLSAR